MLVLALQTMLTIIVQTMVLAMCMVQQRMLTLGEGVGTLEIAGENRLRLELYTQRQGENLPRARIKCILNTLPEKFGWRANA